jgi:hypothetical protein
MKRIISLLAVTLIVLAVTVQAQESKSSTRLQAQHKYNTRFLEKHLKQTEASLVKALEDSSVGMQKNSLQTIRELEQIFPEYPFSSLLIPLENKLRDENANGVVRMLVAIALDGLHSDAGDAIVKETGDSSNDKGLKTLCEALVIKSGLYK